MHSTPLLPGVLLLTLVRAIPAQAPPNDPAPFIAWARANAQPLASATPRPDTRDLGGLREIAGTARVIGVGESAHGVREFLGLRQRAAQFLVGEMGFTAVALETGLPDARIVYDYVLGAPAPAGLWDQGFTWTMASFEGTRQLIEWMRTWNQDPAHVKKIRFYGMDVAGANGSWIPALNQVLAYLDQVEPEYASVARGRLVPLAEKFARADFSAANDAYSTLVLADRQALAAWVTELADRLQLLRHSYLAKSTSEAWDWAQQIATNLAYANAMLTNYADRKGINPVWNARDRAMAENVRWIRQREGAGGGVVVLAHNAHVQKARSVQVPANQAVQGMFLASILGDDYRSVGFTFGSGAMWGGPGTEMALAAADSASLDGVLARVGPPLFLLNLRALPPGPARTWLDRPIVQRIQHVATPYPQLQSWDGLIFVKEISPSPLAAVSGEP